MPTSTPFEHRDAAEEDADVPTSVYNSFDEHHNWISQSFALDQGDSLSTFPGLPNLPDEAYPKSVHSHEIPPSAVQPSGHRGSTSSSMSFSSNSLGLAQSPMDGMVEADNSPTAWSLPSDEGYPDGLVHDPAATNDFINEFLVGYDSPSPPDAITSASPLPMNEITESQYNGPAPKRRKAQPKKKLQSQLDQAKRKPQSQATRGKKTRPVSPASDPNRSNGPSPPLPYGQTPSPGTNFNTVPNGAVNATWQHAPSVPINSPLGQSRSNSASMPTHGLPIGNTPPAVPIATPIPAPMPVPNKIPRLVIHPLPPKSRVETQIPFKMTIHNLPPGIKRLHIPTHSIAKPKLLHKPTPQPSPDMLELSTLLVCTSAMADEARRVRAFEWAAEKPLVANPNNPISKDAEEHKAQNGGEVRICQGCMNRERKRSNRKKIVKPEDEELANLYEHERAIVFNTQEVKDWQRVTPLMADPTGGGFGHVPPEGTYQVDCPMRITCYCRHHSEKQGFKFIVTLKNYLGIPIAQSMSGSIIITDDHKNPPASPSNMESQHHHQHPNLPQPPAPNGTSSIAPQQPVPVNASRSMAPVMTYQPHPGETALPIRHTQSTSDLQAMGQAPFAFSPPANQMNNSQVSSACTSRQASPASPSGPGTRKRKASLGAKIPPGLAMTKIETNPPVNSMALNPRNESTLVSTHTSPFIQNPAPFPVSGEMISPQAPPPTFDNMRPSFGPISANATTNSINGAPPFIFGGSINLDLAENHMYHGPVSAQPSRATSPTPFSHRSTDMLPVLTAAPPTILRIIPNEGPKSGGVEITVLGRNFTNDGLEVYFGGSKATTTTYWGESSLVCLLPPSPSPGMVQVTIRHPTKRHSMPHGAPATFTYSDDDEQELIRAALAVLGRGTHVVDFAKNVMYGEAYVSASNNPSHNGNGPMNSNGFTGFDRGTGRSVETSLLRVLDLIHLNSSTTKADLDYESPSGHTMLHRACSLGLLRLAARLVSRGANVNARDKNGFTPLHMAVMNDRVDLVGWLIPKGADRDARSILGLKPIHVARSRAMSRVLRNFASLMRSRSAGALHSRANSTGSLISHLEQSLTMSSGHEASWRDGSDSGDEPDDEESTDDADSTETHADWLDMRRTSMADHRGISKRTSMADLRRHSLDEIAHTNATEDHPASPSDTITALREQFAAQLQQLQHAVATGFQNPVPQLQQFQHLMATHLQNFQPFQMPNMPQMMPDYPAYLHAAPVMQRISSLVPNIRGQRPESGDSTSNPPETKWGGLPFFGVNESPPAYEDVFPQKVVDVKQASAAQAAAEYEADAKCTTLYDQPSSEGSTVCSHTEEMPTSLQIGRKHQITKEQQENLQRAHAQRLKTVSRDKMLWFVWIPLLTLVLGAMLWSGASSLASSTTGAAKTCRTLLSNPQEIRERFNRYVQELA
ncbi:hypothetical protein GGR57DRAFT_80519 [Xylariaceae sp. FL1272]|nr:hypothetical protein GGR57DRAFT_80519 [Xylariaceae sp. FL1272]